MTATAWIVALLALLVGAAAAAAGTWIWMRRTYGDRESATRLRNELEAYRGEVHEHFVETARRVDALTHAYKDVYDHLERGAYRLVGEAELRDRLEDTKSEPVTIEGIGQRRLTETSGHRAAASRRPMDEAPPADAPADDAPPPDAPRKRSALRERANPRAAPEPEAEATPSGSGAEEDAGAQESPGAPDAPDADEHEDPTTVTDTRADAEDASRRG